MRGGSERLRWGLEEIEIIEAVLYLIIRIIIIII